MPILPSSEAVATGAGVYNQQFTPAANDIQRNIVIIGTFLPALAAGITVETVYGPYSNASQIATIFGNGTMLHRLAIAVFTGAPSGGPTVWVIPQAESTPTYATSATFVITGPASAAGTLAVYVDNIRYAVSVASGDSATTIGNNLAAAFAADPNCPVTSINTSGSVACTSIAGGPWGNSIPVAINIQTGDALPTGVAVTVTALTTGAGVPVIANALNNALGIGSNANTLPGGQWMTDLVHGYLASGSVMATTAQDQTTVAAISAYNGLANTNPPVGCYDHTVGKPFRCIMGDATKSTTFPSALSTFATTNTYDRTDGILCVPGSRTHPCEIAATATAAINVRAGAVSSRPYSGMVLPASKQVPRASGHRNTPTGIRR